jgi:putative DNA primase/helicase
MRADQYRSLAALADAVVAEFDPTPPTWHDQAPTTTEPDHGARPDGVILTCAADLKPEPIAWLWRDWLAAGKMHILAGAPGQGKTTIALAFAATVTCGGRWPDGSRCPVGSALIWSGEDDPADTLLPRLLASGADPRRIHFVTGARIGGQIETFDPARDMPQLEAAADRIGDVRLIMVDPVVSVVTGDSHKGTEVRRALQPLVDLAARLGAALVGITHFSKGGQGQDPAQRVLGSVAFTAVARVVLVAAKVRSDDGEDRRILARSKSNIGPDDGGFTYHLEQAEPLPGIHASYVTWGDGVAGSARELLTDPSEESVQGEDNAQAEGIDEMLIRFIGRDTVPAAEVKARLKAEGYSAKQIRTASSRVGVNFKKSGFGKELVGYWSLPPGIALPDDDAHTCPSPPLVPIRAHTCPSPEVGTNGHEWKNEGTNGVIGDDAEVI